MEEAFENAVHRGQKDGSISPNHDARALARFLTASLNGLQVIGKAGPDDGSLADTVKIVSRLLK
jgi:TetR/AcrR family transcriptional repressor of nem operon